MRKKHSPLQKTLNVWAIILILWSVYRIYFKTDLPLWFDEFIAKPLVFIVPIYHYITNVEKKNFFAGIDLHFKNLASTITLGIFIGIFFFVSGALGLFLRSKDVVSLITTIPLTTIGTYFVIAFATSVSEEIVSRGFLLKRLYDNSKNFFGASFLASVLFFFLHVPILFTSERIVGIVLARVMITDLILSLAVSFIFLERKNLILPIVIHTFYSFSIYLFI